MKLFLPAALLLSLASCSGPAEPKFKTPAVVNADNAPIHESMEPNSRVLALADKGDTLEFDGMATSELCTVKPDAHYGRFPKSEKIGYINRKYLAITPAVMAKQKAGSLSTLDNEPAHLNK
jgi:hypothetical protein